MRRPAPVNRKAAAKKRARSASSKAKEPIRKRCKAAPSATREDPAEKLGNAGTPPAPAFTSPEAMRQVCQVVHQIGLVGGEDYDPKEKRLLHLLERLPCDGGAMVVFVDPENAAEATAAVERSRRTALNPKLMSSKSFDGPSYRQSRKVATPLSSSRENLVGEEDDRKAPIVHVLTTVAGKAPLDDVPYGSGVQYVVNYDLPPTAREYLRRLNVLPDVFRPEVCYTLIDDSETKSRSCREFVGLLKRARSAAKENARLGGQSKAAEFDSILQQFEEDGEEEEEEEEEDDDDDIGACDCPHCQGKIAAAMSFHRPTGASAPRVEVVRLPLQSIENLEKHAPLIAPRLPGHVCTIIALHCLYVHNPWDGFEQLFAPLALEGSVRVVLVLAEDSSWHDYPDTAALCAGGVSWMDILDMDSMDRTDALLERLVDHEAELLGGDSEKIIMMGMSQGGGQSMLRFLRSRRRLGGWLGSVCHVPTAPHTPRSRDPLVDPARTLVNCDRPVRLLSGECDSVFPPGLVLRDADRLREVGGFTDVQVDVQRCMAHDGFQEPARGALAVAARRAADGVCKGPADSATLATMRRAMESVPDLCFLQRNIADMVGKTASKCTPTKSPKSLQSLASQPTKSPKSPKSPASQEIAFSHAGA